MPRPPTHCIEDIQQLKRRAGFGLNASRSGKSSSALPGIHQDGQRRFAARLLPGTLGVLTPEQAIQGLLSHYPERQRKRKRLRTKMGIKLASKFLVIAWTLMKKKEPFSSSYLKL